MSRVEKPTRQQEGVDGYYQRIARDYIDVLHDKRLLNDDLSREALDIMEDYVAYVFQSIADSTKRMVELTAKFRDTKAQAEKQ